MRVLHHGDCEDNMIAAIIKRIITCIKKDLNEQTDQSSKSQREINFLKPKLDYLNAGQKRMSV